MNFMESPRGHILRFLWKQAGGSFKEMSLDALKEKLVSRGMDEQSFIDALSELQSLGLLEDGKLTANGLEAMKIEYTEYLVEMDAKPMDTLSRQNIASARVEFESRHAAVEAAGKE